MKRNVFFFAALTCAANLYAVEPVDTAKAVMLQDVQVTSTRAGKHTPMAFSNFDQSQIKSVNFGQDIPYILSLTPSITTTSDAGNGSAIPLCVCVVPTLRASISHQMVCHRVMLKAHSSSG